MIDIAKFESLYKKQLKDYITTSERLNKRGNRTARFDENDLHSVQKNFYDLMYYRCRNADNCIKWLDENIDSLPKITSKLLTTTEQGWISIPGMYGGFAYLLTERNGKPLLITDSWVRVVGGSGQTHEISPTSITLVAEGYV